MSTQRTVVPAAGLVPTLNLRAELIRELNQLDERERAAWASFESSKKPRSVDRRQQHVQGSGDWKQATVTTEQRDGEPKWLRVMNDISKLRLATLKMLMDLSELDASATEGTHDTPTANDASERAAHAAQRSERLTHEAAAPHEAAASAAYSAEPPCAAPSITQTIGTPNSKQKPPPKPGSRHARRIEALQRRRAAIARSINKIGSS